MHAHSSFNFSEILSDKQEKNKDVGYKKIIGAGITQATTTDFRKPSQMTNTAGEKEAAERSLLWRKFMTFVPETQ